MDLGEEVNVPDSSLKSEILTFIGKNPEAIVSVMQTLRKEIDKGVPMVGYESFDRKEKIITPDFLIYDEGRIYAKELLDFSVFYAADNISDITGLEYMQNLKYLHLESTHITDITPLQNLTNLEILLIQSDQKIDITPLQGLTNLWLLGLIGQITNITPLQNLTNLEYLDVGHNEITDITPLKDLTNLKELYLDRNDITDIQPLVDNEGIGSGDYVDIRYNYLDLTPGSEDMENIQKLLGGGVELYYDPQN